MHNVARRGDFRFACVVLIDPQAIGGMFVPANGFHRPLWPEIYNWLQTNVPNGDPIEVWTELVQVWLDHLRDDLGGSYAVYETAESFFVTDAAKDSVRRLQKFADEAIITMRDAWPGVAWEGDRQKAVVLLFSDADDYYQYISHFYVEGECPQSTGVWLRDGYTHIAAQAFDEIETSSTILHELVHDALGHLVLPRWLDEALARTMERRMTRQTFLGESQMDSIWTDMSGWSAPIMWDELAERHFAFWNFENIQKFWSGHSFYVAGDSNELSYSLAEVLLKLLTEKADTRTLMAFVQAAGQHNDGGLTAAYDSMGIDLGDVAATFLGPGDWRPNRKRIAELNANPDPENEAK